MERVCSGEGDSSEGSSGSDWDDWAEACIAASEPAASPGAQPTAATAAATAATTEPEGYFEMHSREAGESGAVRGEGDPVWRVVASMLGASPPTATAATSNTTAPPTASQPTPRRCLLDLPSEAPSPDVEAGGADGASVRASGGEAQWLEQHVVLAEGLPDVVRAEGDAVWGRLAAQMEAGRAVWAAPRSAGLGEQMPSLAGALREAGPHADVLRFWLEHPIVDLDAVGDERWFGLGSPEQGGVRALALRQTSASMCTINLYARNRACLELLCASELLPAPQGRKRVMFASFPAEFELALTRQLAGAGWEREYREGDGLWLLAADASLPTAPEFPEGVVVSALRACDAGVVNAHWAYKSDTSLAMIQAFIQAPHTPTSGLYVGGELCCWALTYDYGAMGMVFTRPAHRRRGYAFAVAVDLLGRLRAQSPRDHQFCYINDDNGASERLFASLGFELHSTVYWLVYGQPKDIEPPEA